MSRPTVESRVPLADLPRDEQHELLLDVFGEHLFWARNAVLLSVEQLLNSQEQRERLATVFREPYDRAAFLDSEQRKVVVELMQSGIDSFAKELLRILGNEGLDLQVNSRESVRYRIEAEVCSLDSGEVKSEQTISRGGKTFLPECWGRWLNKFRR